MTVSRPFSFEKNASIPFKTGGMMEAEIQYVTAEGLVYVKIFRQTGDIIRGPFPILMAAREPAAGDMALVGFMEGRPDEIIVLGIFGEVFSARSVTAGTTVTQDDSLILGNANSASFIITLPAIASAPRRIVIKKTDASANVVRVTPTGATVENASYVDLASQYASATIIHDGSNWWII